MMINIFSFALLILSFVGTAKAGNELFSSMKATAALDLLAPVYTSDSENRAFNPEVRSAEFMLYGAVDHYFEGTINFAGHTEGGEFFLELHEGYLSSSKTIPYSRIKAGKFFLGVGRLNQFHQHDWPFITAPQSHKFFFDEETAADTGIEYSFLFPTENFFEITLGLTRNYCYGHCHGDTAKPPRPLFYIHPLTFFEFTTQSGLQLGLSYLNRKDHAAVETHLAGFDLTYKYRQGKRLVWLMQAEAYMQLQNSPGISQKRHAGGYLLAQYGLNPAWSFALRFDAFSELTKKFQSNMQNRDDFDYAIVPIITWKPSEFSVLRFSYDLAVDTTEGVGNRVDHLAQIQLAFIIGAHPAHDF